MTIVRVVCQLFLFSSLDAGYLMMGFGASIEVQTTKEFKVSGCIGPCISQKKSGPSVGELEIGEVRLIEMNEV